MFLRSSGAEFVLPMTALPWCTATCAGQCWTLRHVIAWERCLSSSWPFSVCHSSCQTTGWKAACLMTCRATRCTLSCQCARWGLASLHAGTSSSAVACMLSRPAFFLLQVAVSALRRCLYALPVVRDKLISSMAALVVRLPDDLVEVWGWLNPERPQPTCLA